MPAPQRGARRNDFGTPIPQSQLQQNQFEFASLTYPEDINNISHAILFNINVQDSSSDVPLGGNIEQQARGLNSRERVDAAIGRNTTNRYAQPGQLGLTRRSVRVLRAIALYVPETVNFSDTQDYDTPKLSRDLGITGAAAASAASAAQAGIGTGNLLGLAGLGSIVGMSLGRNAIGTASGARSALGQAGTFSRSLSRLSSVDRGAQSAAQLAGFPVNPVIEVLYNSPQLRNFDFTFTFSPRSDTEAQMVRDIIYEFRRHAAPELKGIGVFFTPPSDFDITFLQRQSSGSFVENINIPRIRSCVLYSIDTDYASSGQFSTFSDGMPIQIRMILRFKELEIITREKVDQGY